MITKTEALAANHFHYTGKHECTRIVGPRGGIKISIVECRRNGQTKLWKTRPNHFRVPLKYGLYEHAYLDHDNAQYWHTPDNCPLNTFEE